jgi:hypothetical protein
MLDAIGHKRKSLKHDGLPPFTRIAWAATFARTLPLTIAAARIIKGGPDVATF